VDTILFGSNNPTGASFLQIAKNTSIETWGRKAPINRENTHVFCDLSEDPQDRLKPLRGVLVSFAPIWLLAPFLRSISTHQPQILEGLVGVIACSSSSFMTKRFAFNKKDRDLALCLSEAHSILWTTCGNLGIPCQVLAPTLVYGSINGYHDKNISQIIEIMKRIPVICLPSESGLRQPIHASQLAKVALHQANRIFMNKWDKEDPLVLTIGGDEILTYESMVLKIRERLNKKASGRTCKVVRIPEKMFFLLSAPILPINPKVFEALMRMKSNLSGFSKAHEILGVDPQVFPILPLPIDK
jgi:hypothetical protein